jgi:hypothetical protein
MRMSDGCRSAGSRPMDGGKGNGRVGALEGGRKEKEARFWNPLVANVDRRLRFGVVNPVYRPDQGTPADATAPALGGCRRRCVRRITCARATS